jgi:hypothetical protein
VPVAGGEPLWVRASTSTLSYPAPLWQIYLSDFGRRAISSLSNGPVSCTHNLLSRLPSSASIVDVRMWSCSIGRVPRHRRTLRFVASAGSLFCCHFHIPGVGQLRYLSSAHTINTHFQRILRGIFFPFFVGMGQPTNKQNCLLRDGGHVGN